MRQNCPERITESEDREKIDTTRQPNEPQNERDNLSSNLACLPILEAYYVQQVASVARRTAPCGISRYPNLAYLPYLAYATPQNRPVDRNPEDQRPRSILADLRRSASRMARQSRFPHGSTDTRYETDYALRSETECNRTVESQDTLRPTTRFVVRDSTSRLAGWA